MNSQLGRRRPTCALGMHVEQSRDKIFRGHCETRPRKRSHTMFKLQLFCLGGSPMSKTRMPSCMQRH